ncbi:hypothetical protein DFH29DRAFT_874115 [Suillus ampliporus]|nr:hypothetical protein DFH29DRAFT_874115 [Suillus ampliporus]
MLSQASDSSRRISGHIMTLFMFTKSDVLTTFRVYFTVRTREESLNDLHRRRRRNAASVESIKKKLTRMNQETKAFGAQMDALNIACEHMRDLDAKIAHEESTIGAFKRKCTKNWLSLKFGGLAECCEKGMIVAEIGKRMVVVGSMTSGGFGVAQDTHRIVQVVFSGAPSGCEPHEAPQPPPSQSRPNCFKDLPEIRDESFADVASIENSIRDQSTTDPIAAPVEHILSGIGPSTTSTPDYGYQAESSPSRCELSSALPSRRKTAGSSDDRSYSTLTRSRSAPAIRLDSIAEVLIMKKYCHVGSTHAVEVHPFELNARVSDTYHPTPFHGLRHVISISHTSELTFALCLTLHDLARQGLEIGPKTAKLQRYSHLGRILLRWRKEILSAFERLPCHEAMQ